MGRCADRNGPALLDIMHRLVLNSNVINNTCSLDFQLKIIKNNKSVFQVCHIPYTKTDYYETPLSFITTRVTGTVMTYAFGYQ